MGIDTKILVSQKQISTTERKEGVWLLIDIRKCIMAVKQVSRGPLGKVYMWLNNSPLALGAC